MSAELIAIIAVGCTVVGLLLASLRHADVRMDGIQSALSRLGERVARIEGILAVTGHAPEPPESG